MRIRPGDLDDAPILGDMFDEAVEWMVSRGNTEQLVSHFSRARDNGLTKVQAAEAVTHIAFYAGWPRAMSALPAVRAAFEDKK